MLMKLAAVCILLAICACAEAKVSEEVMRRAESLLKKMTVEEKIDYIGGINNFYMMPIERLGIPEIKMSDGPMGCRNYGNTTCYPAGIALAATWNPDLAKRVGVALGRDCRARGVHILLAPAVNIYRSPNCGRNFEYLGEDPYLTSMIVAPEIQGVQSQGALATVKHFACNNQEWDRNRISSEVDERTLREIYLPAFKSAVQVGKVGCVMNAYNLLNGVHCSQNSYLLTDILKKEWGFEGFVMSDWGSTYDGIAAANAGLDLEMPNAAFMSRKNLLPAIQDGRLKESVIDDKIRRILQTFIAAGFFDRPQTLSDIPKDDPAGAKVALDGAREGIVLLKNEKSALPIDRAKIKSIAIIGPNADPAIYCGGGSAFTKVFHSTSISEGVKKLAGSDIEVKYSQLVEVARESDAAVVCVGFNQSLEGEGFDRPFELPVEQIKLINDAAAANSRTIVVINSGGGVSFNGWLDKVPAVLQAWYPGQEIGTAVAEIIFGDVNPSGKLPATFEKNAEDNPSYPYYRIKDNKKTPYTEGIFVGYRGYDKNKTQPQFCFGHGLSYTTFKFSNLKIKPQGRGEGRTFEIACDITNVGKREGSEIAQLYVGDVKSSLPRPIHELKGFSKLTLKPGEKKTAKFIITKDELSFYSPKDKAWIAEPGEFIISIGSSSRDLPLQGKLSW